MHFGRINAGLEVSHTLTIQIRLYVLEMSEAICRSVLIYLVNCCKRIIVVCGVEARITLYHSSWHDTLTLTLSRRP